MKTKYLITSLSLALIPWTAATGQTLTLFDGAGPVDTSSGSNKAQHFTFDTALDGSRNTMDSWTVGDSISLSFNLAFSGFTGASTDEADFNLGFLGNNSGSDHSVAYALLRPRTDSVGEVGTSTFRSREGSLLMSGFNADVPIDPNSDPEDIQPLPPFDTAFMYGGEAVGGNFAVDFTLTKASSTTYRFDLDIGGESIMQVGELSSTITGSAITGFGFRESRPEGFDNGVISDMTVTATAVPEPATTAFLSAAFVFAGVMVRRKLIAKRALSEGQAI